MIIDDEVILLNKGESKEYVGSKEAANMPGVTASTISRYCREKKFKNAEQDAKGSPWRIPVDEIQEMLKRRKRK